MKNWLFAAPLFVLSAASAVADPQYTVVSLHPNIGGNSLAIKVRNGQQVGNALWTVDPNFYGQATLWTGTAASAVNLNPAGHEGSVAYATNGAYQVGATIDNGGGQTVIFTAAIWQGTPASYINMAPAGATASRITGVDNGIFAGWCTFGSWLPGYWTSTSGSSWHELPMPYPSNGQVAGISGNRIVGEVDITTQQHAFAWNVSANTYVDLHPAGYAGSLALATDTVQDAGEAANVVNNRYFYHAGVWDVATSAFTDLHPSGWTESQANDVKNGFQVGTVSAQINGVNTEHAGVWNGTAASFVDLQQFLPNTTRDSEANGIDAAGDIVGEYYDGSSWKAVMWVPVVQGPPPYTFLGFFAPINDPATPESNFKGNRTVPLKFTLQNSDGLTVINASCTITLQIKNGNTWSSVNSSLFEHPSDNGTACRFDGESGQYEYSLDTKNLKAGEYRITVTVADTGQTHSDTFSIASGK